MGQFDKCTVCGHWGFTGSHKCPPKWRCRERDIELEQKFAGSPSDYEWVDVHANDPETAATEFAEDFDRDNEYSVAGDGNDLIVEVRKVGTTGSDSALFFKVNGSMDPTYTAASYDLPGKEANEKDD